MDNHQIDPVFAFRTQLETCRDANQILQAENKCLSNGQIPEEWILTRKRQLLEQLDTGLTRLRMLREEGFRRSPELKQLKTHVANRIMSLLLLSRENEKMLRQLEQRSRREEMPAAKGASVSHVRQAYMKQLNDLN